MESPEEKKKGLTSFKFFWSICFRKHCLELMNQVTLRKIIYRKYEVMVSRRANEEARLSDVSSAFVKCSVEAVIQWRSESAGSQKCLNSHLSSP